MRYEELIGVASMQTWAMAPTRLSEFLGSVREGTARKTNRLPKVNGQIAVIPIQGMITQRPSLLSEIFGGTSTERLEMAVSRAAASERIKAIVMPIDSPGGTSAGVEAAADTIWAARGTKPIIAIADSEAASAAYWLGSQAETFIAAPGSDLGSIGVFRMHQDVSRAMDEQGITTTLIAIPEHKVEGNPFEPLSEDAKEHQMEQVKETYAAFVKAVARGRGVTAGQVKSDFGKGRMFKANQAAKRGMVDRVATMSKVISELGGGRSELDGELTADINGDLPAMPVKRKLRELRLKSLDTPQGVG